MIYVRGARNAIERVWENAHPRGARTNTTLTLFDYADDKRRTWTAWKGELPPKTAPDTETTVSSVLELYDYVKNLSAGTLVELHFFTHGFEGGPVLHNTFDTSVDPDARDPDDDDPRIKDFKIASVLGGSNGARFKRAFASKALIKLWGCTHREDLRQKIKRGFYRARSSAAKKAVKKAYQEFIRDGTYQFALHRATGLPVFAAPVGWGTNPFLPFGIHGKKAGTVKAKFRGRFPPRKGDRWWRVSQWFQPDRGRAFYTKELKASLDLLDYVAYEEALVK